MPPTPPATLSTLSIAPSGMRGARPAARSGRFGRVTAAATTIETNIRSTSTLSVFSNSAYRPDQTRTSPITPETMPQAMTPSAGKRACRARPVPAIAAAP